MTDPSTDLYDDPAVYDILHSPGTRDEVDILERIARSHLGGSVARQRWLEPACGSGRYLRTIAGRGRRVFGFDQSPTMIDYAKERARSLGLSRRIGLFVADMVDFARVLDPGSIHFAFNTINTIRHLESDAAMRDHFAQMAEALAADGVYAVGVSLSAYGREAPSEDVWEGSRGRCKVQQVVQYLPPEYGGAGSRVETVVSHLTITRPRGVEHQDSRYGLRTYNRKQWRRLVQGSSLRILSTVSDRARQIQDHDGLYVIYVLGRR